MRLHSEKGSIYRHGSSVLNNRHFYCFDDIIGDDGLKDTIVFIPFPT